MNTNVLTDLSPVQTFPATNLSTVQNFPAFSVPKSQLASCTAQGLQDYVVAQMQQYIAKQGSLPILDNNGQTIYVTAEQLAQAKVPSFNNAYPDFSGNDSTTSAYPQFSDNDSTTSATNSGCSSSDESSECGGAGSTHGSVDRFYVWGDATWGGADSSASSSCGSSTSYQKSIHSAGSRKGDNSYRRHQKEAEKLHGQVLCLAAAYDKLADKYECIRGYNIIRLRIKKSKLMKNAVAFFKAALPHIEIMSVNETRAKGRKMTGILIHLEPIEGKEELIKQLYIQNMGDSVVKKKNEKVVIEGWSQATVQSFHSTVQTKFRQLREACPLGPEQHEILMKNKGLFSKLYSTECTIKIVEEEKLNEQKINSNCKITAFENEEGKKEYLYENTEMYKKMYSRIFSN